MKNAKAQFVRELHSLTQYQILHYYMVRVVGSQGEK